MRHAGQSWADQFHCLVEEHSCDFTKDQILVQGSILRLSSWGWKLKETRPLPDMSASFSVNSTEEDVLHICNIPSLKDSTIGIGLVDSRNFLFSLSCIHLTLVF